MGRNKCFCRMGDWLLVNRERRRGELLAVGDKGIDPVCRDVFGECSALAGKNLVELGRVKQCDTASVGEAVGLLGRAAAGYDPTFCESRRARRRRASRPVGDEASDQQ